MHAYPTNTRGVTSQHAQRLAAAAAVGAVVRENLLRRCVVAWLLRAHVALRYFGT